MDGVALSKSGLSEFIPNGSELCVSEIQDKTPEEVEKYYNTFEKK
jgi:hypothetical protein